MKRRLSRPHCFAGFGPNFGFDTTAADCARGLAVLKEEHLGSATLWRRSARMRDGRDDHSFAASIGLVDEPVKFVLSDGSHWYARLRRAIYRIHLQHAGGVRTAYYGLGVGVGLGIGCKPSPD